MRRRIALELSGPALVAWTLAAPWVWGFDDSEPAVASHIAFAIAFGPNALLAPALAPAGAVLSVAGVWLAVSPWVLGYAGVGAAWAVDLSAGIALIVVGARLTCKRNRPEALTR